MDNLNYILSSFSPISLKEMDRVKLQNRTDTKYIFNFELLPIILDEIREYYSLLEINGKRTNSYQTLYYDTPCFNNYINHHNGKLNRFKLRFRKYLDSGIAFLEIKFKNNKGRTIKSRLQTKDIEIELIEDSKKFISDNSSLNSEQVKPTLWNNFTRLTLVHKEKEERLTIDYNLNFTLFGETDAKSIQHLVIAEVKQPKANSDSDFVKTARKHHIRTSGMSKYCVGIAMLNKRVKSNNFKERILKINKLENVRRITA